MNNLVELTIRDDCGQNHIICERIFVCDVLRSCLDTDTFLREIEIKKLQKEE